MKISVHNVYCNVELEKGDKPEIMARIRTRLSTHAPGFQYTKAFKTYKKTGGMHGWDGRVNLFTNGNFLTGLLPEVLEVCKKNRMQVTLDDKRVIHQVAIHKWGVKLRDYQHDAITKAIENTVDGWWWPRGIIHIATGGGKTEVAAAMLEMLQVPSIFIVHRKDLLHQAAQRFQKYNIPCGICGDGNWDTSQRVTVATFQSIMAMQKRDPQQLGFLKQVEQVFFDEAHHIAASSQKGNTFVKLSAALPNAFMRWGLTATPFMKDKYSNLLLQGATGKVLFSLKSDELIKKGYLAKPTVWMIRSKKKEDIPGKWPHCYEWGIVRNEERNRKIGQEVLGCEPPILVLVERIHHGEILKDMTGIPFISGDDPTEVRKEVTDDLRKGKYPAIIATTIYDEGIDIPEIKTLIIAAGGKSPIRGRQRIGRGLRKAFGKNTVKIIDFMDWTTKYLFLHSRQRLQVWKEEGYEIKEIGSEENTFNN